MGAVADVLVPETGSESVSTSQFPTDGSAIVIGAGNGIMAPGGLNVPGNVYIGATNDMGGANGTLVALNTTNPVFSVVSGGNVSIGSMLQVLSGREFGIKTSGTGWDVSVGAIDNQGTFKTENINTFTSGAINSTGAMDVVANDKIDIGGLVVTGAGATTLSAGANGIVSGGTIQNNAGQMTINSAQNISVTGSLENSGTGVSVNGQDVTIAGVVTNNSGNLNVVANNLQVNGGNTASYSVINKGATNINVANGTSFAHGINFNGMNPQNTFSLVTGTLNLGSNNSLIAGQSEFVVNVKAGGLTLGTVQNTTSDANYAANMTVSASGDVVADSVVNRGNALALSGNGITINNALTGIAGSVTNVTASGVLTATNAAISSAGDMTLNASKMYLASVVNGDGDLVLKSSPSSGVVSVAGDVKNTGGDVTISAKDVSVGGTLSNTRDSAGNAGVITISASDAAGEAVQIGAIDASAGVINVDALMGDVDVGGAFTVSGGAFNAENNLRNLTIGGNAKITGDFTASSDAATGSGNMNVAVKGAPGFTMVADSIFVGGNVDLTAADTARNVTFNAPVINVSQGVNVGNLAKLTLGANATTYVSVADSVNVSNGGTVETFANNFYVGDMLVNGLFVAHGPSIVAQGKTDNSAGNGISISGNLYFDPDNDDNRPNMGLLVQDTNTLTLQTNKAGADISLGATYVGAGKKLMLNSGGDITIGGELSNNGNIILQSVGAIAVKASAENADNLSLTGASVTMSDISYAGTVSVVATNGNAILGALIGTGNLSVQAADNVSASIIEQTDGILTVNSDSLSAQNIEISGDSAVADLNVSNITVKNVIDVAGDVTHGGDTGMLNIDATNIQANSFEFGGDFTLMFTENKVNYTALTDITVGGDINVYNGVSATLDATRSLYASDFTNAGNINVVSGNGISFENFVNNAGNANLDSGAGILDIYNFTLNGGNVALDGAGLSVGNNLEYNGVLYQGAPGTELNIASNDYVINTAKISVGGINQTGKLVINTSDITVNGDIIASDLQFVAQTDDQGKPIWQNIAVNNGTVYGGVDFLGLEKMTINNGNYVFDAGSRINAAVLPYVPGAMNTTDIDYWARVNLDESGALGQITNPDGDDARALILVDGTFKAGQGLSLNGSQLAANGGKIDIVLYDAIDQGTAIWLVHANDGIFDFSSLELIRNLNVRYCNADGSICYDYLTSLDDNNKSDDDLPAYVSVRDSDNDGVSDDLYVVFDPRFGGPVLLSNTKLQSIVGRTPGHTKGEYASAGALDNMVLGQLRNTNFTDKAPIEVLSLIFQGTNLEIVANELYHRMDAYAPTFDGSVLTRFARLFQVHELEQAIGSIVLNEHTSFRSFEDRMFDEFIWNRNRTLKKAWVDVDYGMFFQDVQDRIHSDGNRFSIAGGFDWQHSKTLILGLTGRVSHIASTVSDSINLGYAENQSIAGHVHSDVTDTNVAVGGYLMKNLDDKFRVYGNAFADIHFLDIEREQNYVSQIKGDGNTFSLTTEWGLIHDILNQYVVGNLYARAGYNFGFDITETAGGMDYMNMESDGYFMLTPGYSLVAQKRIYPSAWFQIRPYASVGVEYDLFGAPDNAKYKFAIADAWTKYDIDINPLWANIGGGVEFLAANGVQVGIDYRYQYNDAIQLHNIKASLSYRF